MQPEHHPLAAVVTEEGTWCRLSILVSPKSSHDGIGPLEGDRIRVRVTAAASDNAANKAVIRLLSDRLAVPRSSMEIDSGLTSRRKRVAFALSAEELRARLASLLAEQEADF